MVDMNTHRTRFAVDIVSEFIPPEKPSNKVVIFCAGMPTVPNRKELMKYIAKKGCWAVFPRYRGTWESGGEFLKEEPTKDILDVMDYIDGKVFVGAWDKQEYRIENAEYYLLAGSFGGPAGLLLSKDPRVKKVVAVSPVVDWSAPSEEEPLDWMRGFVREAFGEGYRYTDENWKKLGNGPFYNPVAQKEKVDGGKILFIHAKDDRSVLSGPVEQFAREIGSEIILLKKGGHLSSSIVTSWKVLWKLKRFLRS